MNNQRDFSVAPEFIAWEQALAKQGVECVGNNEVWNAAVKATKKALEAQLKPQDEREAQCRADCDVCGDENGNPWPCAKQQGRERAGRASLAAQPEQQSEDHEAAIARMKARPLTCTPEVLANIQAMFDADPSLPEIAGCLPRPTDGQSAQPEVTSWAFDMSPAQGFIDYIAKNYSGEVVFHDPEWHALRLWNAALKHAKPEMVRTAQPQTQPAPALSDERVLVLANSCGLFRETKEGRAAAMKFARAILQAAQPVVSPACKRCEVPNAPVSKCDCMPVAQPQGELK